MPAGATVIRLCSRSSLSQVLNSFARYTPLGPVEYPIDRAESTARLTPPAELISGCGVPAGTAIAIADTATSIRLPATILDAAVRSSIASFASTTRSNVSPAFTRFAASTPPMDSSETRWDEVASNCAVNSASSRRVAIDETTRIGDGRFTVDLYLAPTHLPHLG